MQDTLVKKPKYLHLQMRLIFYYNYYLIKSVLFLNNSKYLVKMSQWRMNDLSHYFFYVRMLLHTWSRNENIKFGVNDQLCYNICL